MRQREETGRRTSSLEGTPAERKPYQKPAVRYERVFETSALVCGKIQTTQYACKINRKSS
jgi:hypothetical protein